MCVLTACSILYTVTYFFHSIHSCTFMSKTLAFKTITCSVHVIHWSALKIIKPFEFIIETALQITLVVLYSILLFEHEFFSS